MFGGRTFVVVLMSLLLAGCARTRSGQQLSRLQSQVGLLDERVTQLERTGVSGTSSAPIGEAPADFGSSAPAMTRPERVRSTDNQTVGKTSAKPTTREIQQALKNAGFYQGIIDGKMGPQTREAIKEFQRVHGLNDDGVAGRQTWAKLGQYAEMSAAEGKEKRTSHMAK